MSTQSPIPFLRRTQSSAQALASKLAAHAPKSPPASCSVASPPVLTLPAATRSLGPRLVDLGIDGCAATRVVSAVLRACQDLKSSFEEDFRRRGHIFQSSAPYFNEPKSASLIPSAYAIIYTKTVNDWISYIIDNFAPRLLHAISLRTRAASETPSEGSSPRRRPFNSNAIPTLELFFGQNAFPSRLEKYELASKCDMEYRQIHVWFQNRRSRFRKEGRELKQPNRRGALSDELENTIVDTLLPISPADEGDHELPESRSIPEPLNSTKARLVFNPLQVNESPAHAFPSPYPPLCPCNPFPLDSPARAFSLPWLRFIHSATAPSKVPVDVAELTTLFAKMSLSQEESVHHSDATTSRKSACRFIGFMTACTRAPHPALIRRPRRTARSPCLALQSEPCRGRSDPGQPTSARGRLPRGHNPPNIHPPPPKSTRPKRSLPQRYPKHPPMYSLDRISGDSTTSGHSLSRSYSSRSTGSNSDIDSPLATPPLLPMVLPIEIVPPPFDEFLFSNSMLTSAPSTLSNTLDADQATKRLRDILDVSALVTCSS